MNTPQGITLGVGCVLPKTLRCVRGLPFLLLFIPDPLLCGGRSLALLVQGHLNDNLKPAGMVGIMGRCATVPRHHIAHESPPPICRAGLRAMQQLKPLI